jgi:hypothetical protein
MATNTAGTQARQNATQQTHYLRKRILGSGGNATYSLGWVPAGANILRISTLNRVVLSGGTPTIALGTRASGAAFFAANGTPATTAGRNNITLIATGTLGVDADTELTATIAGTPTAGTMDVEVEFTVNNDQ